MCSGEDGHVGTKHASVTDGDETAVEDSEIEVGVKTLAEGNVAAIVDVKWGFDD